MPLDTTVRHYTSSMNGAPILNNSANSMIALLDAVLVNGFGNATLTSLTVSSNIATATVSTGFNVAPYCVVTISGATPSGLNGDKKVLTSTANNISFTFDATGIADQTATGTITVKFPGAGWTKPYANTVANVAVYRNNSVSGSGMYLKVTDTSPTSSRINIFESMTDENTGVGQTPTTAQISGGMYLTKSNNTATAKKWWIVADSKTCYIGNAYRADNPDTYIVSNAFGDFYSLKPNDPYKAFIVGPNYDVGNNGNLNGEINYIVSNWDNFNNYRYFLKSFTGAITSKLFAITYWKEGGTTGNSGEAGFSYPNLTNNSLLCSPLYMVEGPSSAKSLRGFCRGIYASAVSLPPTQRLIEDNTAFENLPSPGKICLFKVTSLTGSYGGGFFIDVAGPWD